MKIRAAKDVDPTLTYNDLRQKFGVSPNIIKMALEKSVEEWKSMLDTTTPRTRPQMLVSQPVSIKKEPVPSHEKTTASAEPSITAAASISSGTTTPEWEYHAVIVRSRMQFNDVVYEQQGHDNSDWKLLAVKSFEEVLNLFGNDKWELAAMVVLSHGSTGFTGMYELVFKRKK